MRLAGALAAIGVLALLALRAAAVSEDEAWQASYRFETATPKLVIDNVWGDVFVRGVLGKDISVRVSEHRSARDQETLERSREWIYLDVVESDAGVELIVAGVVRNWRRPNPCPSCRVEYRFEVEAPRGASVAVSTVNDGQVRVEGIHGLVEAGNVNGPVAALDIAACESLSSVNGDLRAEFSVAPGHDCQFETINGDIVTVLPDGAGIDLSLQLGNGRAYSQFEVEALALPPSVERLDRHGAHVYRIEQPAGLKLGAGGPHFKYTSLNGDVRINRSKP